MARQGEIVTLNVGGTIFSTTLTTLGQYRGTSMLAAMFDPESGMEAAMRDTNGAFFIDRNPKAFGAILSYLRTGKLFEAYDGVTMEELLNEAEYFGLAGLAGMITAREIQPNCKEIILLDIAER